LYTFKIDFVVKNKNRGRNLHVTKPGLLSKVFWKNFGLKRSCDCGQRDTVSGSVMRNWPSSSGKNVKRDLHVLERRRLNKR
jgi:hypothetical protein